MNPIIRKLKLQPHPEGGWYSETYRSAEIIHLSDGRQRNSGTAIYFLLEGDEKSKFHRLRSDEIWYFHQGNPLELAMISDGQLSLITLGNDLMKNENPQVFIPAGSWFGARIKDAEGYALVSCSVHPGFDFLDFELANRDELLKQFPEMKEIISQFT